MKVLISLDYNPSAHEVAEKGFSFASAMKAEITLLHVASDPLYYTLVDHITIMGFSSQMERHDEITMKTGGLKELSQQFLDKTKLHLGDKKVKTMFKEGACAESILEAANQIKADIIIMGSHSSNLFKSKTTGGVTESVLINTSIPVLIIPTIKHN